MTFYYILMGNGALIWGVLQVFLLRLFTQYKYHGVLLIVYDYYDQLFLICLLSPRFNRLRPCDNI